MEYTNSLSKESYDLEIAKRDSLKTIKTRKNHKNKVRNNRTHTLLSTKTARKRAPRGLPVKPTPIPPLPQISPRRQSMNRVPGEVQGVSMFCSDNDDEESNNDSNEEIKTRGPCPECGGVDKCLFGCRYGKNKDDNNQCHNCTHVQCIPYMYLSWETDSPYVSHVSSSDFSCTCGAYSISCKHGNMDSNGHCFDCNTSPERDTAREAQALKLSNNNNNNHNSNNSKEKPLSKRKSDFKNENNNNVIVNTLDFEGENDEDNDNDNSNDDIDNVNNNFMMIGGKTSNIGWSLTMDEQVSDVSLQLCDIEVSCHESEMEWPNSFVICNKCCDDHKVCEYECDWSRGNGKCLKCKSKLHCIIKNHKLSVLFSVF